jgi:flagellar biosynthesis protein FlhA
MDAVWISQQSVAEAETHGYIVVNPESVMATHLSQVLHKYASQLIGQDDVQGLLDNLGQTAPHLVESVVPKLVPLHSLTAVLRILLEEGVPISDLRTILEDLPPLAARNLGAVDTAEALRPRLAPLLIQQIAPLNQPLPVMTLDSELEHMLITMVRQSGEEGLILDNTLAEQLLRKISETSETVSARGDQVVMVVSPAIRRQFAQLVRQHIEDLHVLAFTELPDSRKIEVVATISGEAG